MPATGTNNIRILLIDDHVVMRTGLRMVIENQPGLVVVGEATNRATALEVAEREQPDIILLDLDLGNESGIAFLPDLLNVAQAARVIVLTGIDDAQEYRRAVRLGALGLVLKEQAAEVLVQAIKKVYAGEVWLDSALVATILTETTRARGSALDPEAIKIASLTARERQVILLIGEGLYNHQIAERLSISKVTVSHHLTSIFAKLDVATRFDLVVYAYRYGLAKPPH
jgi:two-component system nitrate/nitrite response regulator NarL